MKIEGIELRPDGILMRRVGDLNELERLAIGILPINLWHSLYRCSRCKHLLVLRSRAPKLSITPPPPALRLGIMVCGSESDEARKEPPRFLCSHCEEEFARQEKEINEQKSALCKKFGIPYPYIVF